MISCQKHTWTGQMGCPFCNMDIYAAQQNAISQPNAISQQLHGYTMQPYSNPPKAAVTMDTLNDKLDLILKLLQEISR